MKMNRLVTTWRRCKRPLRAWLVAATLGLPASAWPADSLKVFISVDMEGVTGVVDTDEVRRGKPDYEYFREIMTRETNAAIEGAIAAGATEVLVRDTHGGMNHLLPELMDKRARVVRGGTHPQSMMVSMEGFDGSYDAVVLIAYHAPAGYPNSVLPHTMSDNVVNFSINGVSLSEASYSALIAGLHDVPVVMISGDKAACEEARRTLGNLETVAVKEALNGGAISVHPEVGRTMIRAAVERGVRNRAQFRPYKLSAPYTATLKVLKQGPLMAGAYVNARGEIEFKSPDLLKALNALVQMW
jgi:D-amino peptidase